MIKQGGLFHDETVLDLPDPVEGVQDTSKWAARSIKPVQGADAQMVLRLITEAPDGLTCDEVEAMTERSHQTISARIYDLGQAGYIFRHYDEAGKPTRRRTRSGRKAHVWYGS